MDDVNNSSRRYRLFAAFEIAFIILLAIVPLFSTFPYRVNIFLSWEGAYRLSEGEVPYRDFGMPMGYMYWVIPALFFKIFGAQMITLVKAQVLINILSGLAFRSILKSLSVPQGIRVLSVIVYVISFSFFNFWPWYNHTVIVYEMIGLAFLMRYMFRNERNRILLACSALFIFFSFFTKQDGGGLGLLLCLALLSFYCLAEKKWMPLLIFIASFLVAGFAIIAPLLRFNFGYWFNHGQPPHTARLSLFDIADEFFFGSQWIKFYLFLIILIAFAVFRNQKNFISRKRDVIFLLLTLGILAEAAVLQVTSYTPPDNNIFYHSFAFAYILTYLSGFIAIDFSRWKTLLFSAALIFLWWSGVYWKYFQRITHRFAPPEKTVSASGENIVNRKTYMINRDSTEIPLSEWTFSTLPSFKNIYMPRSTVDGIHRLMQMDVVRNQKNPRILNMTELTPLAVEIPYREEKGPGVPLWYHLGVAMFNKEAAQYEQKITRHEYDLVLFEYIPTLNNFYPFRVRNSLLLNYHKVDSFYAPRRGDTRGVIEVYSR